MQKELHVPQSIKWYLQRFFATEKLSGTGRLMYVPVMLQAGTTIRNGLALNKIWFANSPVFVSMYYKPIVRASSALRMVHNNKCCGICATYIDERHLFVICYDIVPDYAVPKYRLEEKLKCIRLK